MYAFNIHHLWYSWCTRLILFSDDAGGEIEFEVEFLPILDLTTFPGVMELDKTEADATSVAIPIPDGLIFGNEIATLAYVSYT